MLDGVQLASPRASSAAFPTNIMMSLFTVKIDPHNALPLYAQVESILAAAIADGTFPPGSRLPNEDELVERYAVSRTTIRQTVQNLVRRGLIEIRRGKGTFVLQPRITQELTELSGFVEGMHS